LIGDIIRTVAVTPTLGSVAVHSTQAVARNFSITAPQRTAQ
jgi:hypothetical protein